MRRFFREKIKNPYKKSLTFHVDLWYSTTYL